MSTRSRNTFAATPGPAAFQHAGDRAGADWLLNVVDGGLMAVICVAPYFFGGRHDLGRFVYVALVAVMAVAWFARQAIRPRRWRDTAAYGIAIFAIGLLVLQIVPLPAACVQWLAPRNAELLPLWGSSAGLLGDWRTISVAPHETTKALAVLLAHSLLFVVVVQRVATLADIRRLLHWIAISAVAMAAFGIVQFFTSNGSFFWFYEVPYRSTANGVCGSFTNKNHFANFLVLGVGPLACWILETLKIRADAHQRRLAPPLAGMSFVPLALSAGLAVVVFAVLLSMSRGGVLGLLAATLAIGLVYAHGRVVDARYASAGVGLAIVVLGLLSLYGYDQVAHRFATLTKGSVDAIDYREGRRHIWRANVDAIEDGGALGSGVGTHVKIYPVYAADSRFGKYTHAECGYLQIATETGAVGTVLLASAIALCGVWFMTCLRNCNSELETLCFGAICGGLAASLAHSVVDFVWYIPACMSVTLVLAACLLRLAQLTRNSESPAPERAGSPRREFSNAYGVATVLVAGVGVWIAWTFFGPAMAAIHWDRYLRVSIANRVASRSELGNLVANGEMTEATSRNHAAMNEAMMRHLERVVAWDPNFADARLKLARRQLDEFELRQQAAANAMDVAQIRDAAVHSRFASSEQLREWMQRAFGGDCELLDRALTNARAAVALSPLSGDGYLVLSKLCFLDGGGHGAVKAYVEQGVRVRPHDGELLYEVGLQSFAEGNTELAMQHWKRCYQTAGPQQLKVIFALAGRVPAVLFVEEFRPDWQTLSPLWLRYREHGQPQDLAAIVEYAAGITTRETANAHPSDASRIWLGLSRMYRDLQRPTEELACLRHAYAKNPIAFDVRLALGQTLLKAGQFAEAEPHFRWCLARRPADKDLSLSLAQISERKRLQRDPEGGEKNMARAWTR